MNINKILFGVETLHNMVKYPKPIKQCIDINCISTLIYALGESVFIEERDSNKEEKPTRLNSGKYSFLYYFRYV